MDQCRKRWFLLNNTILDAEKGARFMCLDLKNIFLAMHMKTSEYIKVPNKYFPKDLQRQYDLQDKINNRYIYIYIYIYKLYT